MRTPFVLSSLVVLAFGAAAALAQERPAAAPAAAAAASMPMPMDCNAGAMKRHDHGAERNAPSAKSMPCAPGEAASGAKAKARTKPVHDHAKFHKNQ
ncbi:MAG: hypothetical protein Q8N17_07870 [Burkholderiaceae bacterium]|jgi:hypothetical protein|nr:hypothetical protein [Burkholderiaceae bacterium]